MESFTAIEKLNTSSELHIEDFENGTHKLDDIMEEVNYLQQQISLIRQEMASFLTGMANISSSRKSAQQVFDENIQKITTLQKNLDDYIERYKKLIPLFSLIDRHLNLQVPEKLELSIKPPAAASGLGISTQPKNNSISQPKKRTYNKKSTPTPQQMQQPYFQTGQQQQQGQLPRDASGSEHQPILL